tara:strand:+ start:4625 stop:5365 length:741 start_codon:yes stop_codon:yes gene_type:complete
MPKISLKYTATSYIDEVALELSKPLLALTSLTVQDIRSRVTETGSAATGRKFSRYTKGSAKQRNKIGLQTAFKDFKRSGTMWNSLKVKLQTPARATSVFTGRAAHGKVKGKKRKPGPKGGKITVTKLTNNKLGRILNNRESVSIMNGKLSELEANLPMFGDYLTGEVLTAVGLREQAYHIQRKVRGAQRKVKRALKLRRIHGIPSATAYGKKKAARRSRKSFGLRRLLSPKSQLKGERKIYTNTFG